MCDIWKFNDDSNLEDYTLIIPSVAVGNVGQLACDLLISSLDMNGIGSVYHKALVPVVGYDPFNLISSQLSHSCEFYKNASRKIIVVQIRAPLVLKYAREFLTDLILKFKEKQIRDIVILTSSFAHAKKHISTSPFRYVANDDYPNIHAVKELGWQSHESFDKLTIYGGGFASLLYEVILQNSIPSLIIYKYCSEGNNIPDATDMVLHLASLLKIFPQCKDVSTQLVQPVSWKMLFGRPPPDDIY